MPKGGKKSTISMTRKGLIIWGVLFFFIAGWMFILGILVGRGTAPITMDIDRFEKEIADLKSALMKKENVKAGTASGQKQPATTQMEFYEALMQTKPARDFKVDPKLIDREPQKPAAKPTRQTPPEKHAGETSIASGPKPSKPEAPGKSPEIKKGGYTIQVAAFNNAVNCSRLVSRLKEKGFPAYQIQSPAGDGGAVLHRVRVGAFDNRRSAETMLAKLYSQQFKGLVVSTQ